MAQGKCTKCGAKCNRPDGIAADGQCEKCKQTDSVPELIINEVLTYVFHVFGQSSQDSMKKTLRAFYDDEEIHKAKECLWISYGEELLGKTPKRQGSAQKSTKDFEIDDIIKAVEVIDRKKMMNIKVMFCAVNIARVPIFKPEEVDMISVLDRLAVIEQQVGAVMQDVTLHTTQISGLNGDIQRALSYKAAVVANVGQQKCLGTTSNNMGTAGAAAAKIPVKKSDRRDDTGNIQKQTTDDQNDAAEIQAKVVVENSNGLHRHGQENGEQGNKDENSGKTSNEGDGQNEGFQFQRVQRRKQMVLGKNSSHGGVKAAPQTKTLALTNITCDTSDDDVEKFVKSVGSTLSFRKAYNLEKMHTKQFTFLLLQKDVETFLDADKWPVGVCCRFWETKMKKGHT